MIGGTRGGLNRARIINALSEAPMNAHQLSQGLELDYSTIRHHIDVLEKNNLVASVGSGYGMAYLLSDIMIENYDSFEEIWVKIGNKGKNNDAEKGIDE